MRWISHPARTADVSRALHARIIAIGGSMIVCAIFVSAILLRGAPAEKHLAVYSVAANYSLPIVQRDSRDYVGLLEILEPLGKVNGKSEGQRWRLH